MKIKKREVNDGLLRSKSINLKKPAAQKGQEGEMKLLTLTYLIFEVNAAIDTGRHQDITPDEIREKALDGNVIPFIKDKLGDDIDLSLFFDPKTLGELRDTLKVVAGTLHGRERRKVGVERSGLCLLVAYAVEAIQRQSKIGWEPTA